LFFLYWGKSTIIIIVFTVETIYIFAHLSDAIEEDTGKLMVFEPIREVIGMIIVYKVDTIATGPAGISRACASNGVPEFSVKLNGARAGVVVAAFFFVSEAFVDCVGSRRTFLRCHLKIMPFFLSWHDRLLPCSQQRVR